MIKELSNFQKLSPLVILILFVNKQQTAEWSIEKAFKIQILLETCSLLELHKYFNLLWIINNTLASLQILTHNISHR